MQGVTKLVLALILSSDRQLRLLGPNVASLGGAMKVIKRINFVVD